MTMLRLLVPFAVAGLVAQAPSPATLASTSMPVREVTVFKDGHAYVVRDTTLPAGATAIVLDDLPAPVLGTFWPFASDGARLVAAVAGRDTVVDEQVASDLGQIARANLGKDVVVMTVDKERVEGRLLDAPANSGIVQVLVLQGAEGTRVLPLGQVRDLAVHGDFVAKVRGERQRDRLTLRVEGGGPASKVGLMYVQHGLRWIPAYRVEIDGKGKAEVRLEATLVNDLVDLDQADVNLVIGVPKFEFAGLVDPISLQQEMAQVAANSRGMAQFQNLASNAIMTQVAGFAGRDEVPDDGPSVDRGDRNEDLFVFRVRGVTLRRGERLVLPIGACTLGYRDVYRLDVPFAPPMEVRQNLQSERLLELARQLAAPKVRHALRLRNGDDAPLTTAPALVLANGRVLAQGRMTYTPKGAETDLEINVAIDVAVEVEQRETKRDPGPFRLGDDNYARVDLTGSIELRNHKPVPVEVVVTRRTLGLGDAAGQGGAWSQLDLAQIGADGARPAWWGWWNWPYWWFARNGFVEFRWSVTLPPGEQTRLESSWHYFWR